MTTRPRVQQLHQSGATIGQIPTWNGTIFTPEDPPPAICRATFVAAGGETVLYLGVTPVANSEQVFVSGALKVWGGVDYTLTASTITFTSPLSTSARVVVSYFTASTCGIASLAAAPTGFTRPVAITRPVRRFHRIR